MPTGEMVSRGQSCQKDPEAAMNSHTLQSGCTPATSHVAPTCGCFLCATSALTRMNQRQKRSEWCSKLRSQTNSFFPGIQLSHSSSPGGGNFPFVILACIIFPSGRGLCNTMCKFSREGLCSVKRATRPSAFTVFSEASARLGGLAVPAEVETRPEVWNVSTKVLSCRRDNAAVRFSCRHNRE